MSTPSFPRPFEHVPLGLYRSTLDGRFLDVNIALARMLGYPDQLSLLEVQIADLYVDPTAWRRWNALMQINGSVIDFVSQFRCRDGRLIWVSENAQAVRDARGEVEYYEGSLEDITELWRVQAAHREQQALADALRDTAVALSSTLDFDEALDRILTNVGRAIPHDTVAIMLIENEIARVVRCKSHDESSQQVFLGQQLVIKETPSLRQVFETVRPLLISDTQAYPGWIHLPETGWIRSHICAPIYAFGQVVGFLNLDSATPNFFTELHAMRLWPFAYQAAIALNNARAHAEVKLRADQLSLLYDAGIAMNSERDPRTLLELLIALAARALRAERAEFFRYDAEHQLLQLEVSVGYDEQTRAALQQLLLTFQDERAMVAHVARTRRPLNMSHLLAAPAWKALDPALRSGLWTPVEHNDQLLGVLGVLSTRPAAFTEQDERLLVLFANQAAVALENARLFQVERDQFNRLQESQTQLIQAEKMAALGRLVASLAHEINNPLQAVQGCLSLIHEELQGERRQDRIERYVRMSENEIERLTGVVRRVREFYRPVRPEWYPTDVHATLASVLELTNKQLQHSNVVVETDWAHDLPLIRANPDYLKQVFLNLIINAIDAMSARGGTLCIRTALDQMRTPNSEQWIPAVRIEVSDTGEGIPPEMLPHIFEPLFTGKTNGTGMGLSISYSIVEAHSGHITVESQVGQGTTFTIWLPIRAE